MKLLLIVSIIAVFTVDSRELPPKAGASNSLQNSVGHNSGDEDTIEDSDNLNDNPQQLDLIELDQQIPEKETARKERSLRGFKCESTICGILGGSCITNGTTCSGWLVSDGCRGANCHCCIPGTLEMKMKHFELELQSMKDDLANSSMQLKMDFQSMIENITNTKSENQKELQAFRENITDANSNLASQFQAIGQNITTDIAKLQSLKLHHGGHAHPWLGARGNGSSITWDRDGTVLGTDNNWWYSKGYNNKDNTYCLVLMVYENAIKNNPTVLYFMYKCTKTEFTLCEYLKE